MIPLLSYLLPVAYFASVWAYAKAFFRDSLLASRLKTPLLVATVLLHFIYLSLRTVALDHPPITSIPEIMSVISLSIAVGYLVIEFWTKVKNTGYFILILAFFFQLAASLLIQDISEVNPILRSNMLGIHVSAALLGYTAITISAVYGFLYLMLYHNIKSNRFGVIYARLPNLEILERMSSIAIVLGFALLGLAIVIGIVLLPRAFADFSYYDPKLVGTVCIWALYGAGLLAKRSFGWQGRKIMILSIVGFGVSLFSLSIVNVFLSKFHNFY
ncbi:MAG TPA: cytochrome c biogenesis protein CcsA [Bacteroidota bacterium]|nr:cytochrome c biogenesis protein CcsA [Bacteroidota bacterium]